MRVIVVAADSGPADDGVRGDGRLQASPQDRGPAASADHQRYRRQRAEVVFRGSAARGASRPVETEDAELY